MHYIAVGSLLFRHHNNALIQDLLRRVNEETLIGTISYSDPATGLHFYFSSFKMSVLLYCNNPLKDCKFTNDLFQISQY